MLAVVEELHAARPKTRSMARAAAANLVITFFFIFLWAHSEGALPPLSVNSEIVMCVAYEQSAHKNMESLSDSTIPAAEN